MADLIGFTLDDQIRCVERELGKRRAVYPYMIKAKKIKPETAERELALMAAVRRTLIALSDQRASKPPPPPAERQPLSNANRPPF